MRFETSTTIPKTRSLVTAKGTYRNSKGRVTNHARKSAQPMKFVGVDGEGVTVAGQHKYVLFGVGDKQIEDEGGLRYTDVFQFLYEQYKPATAFVGFFLGYDFTQILKTMPEQKAWALLTRKGIAARKHKLPGKPPHPVESEGWLLDMLGTKRLRLRPKVCDCPTPTCVKGCEVKQKPWIYVCDTGSFFQTSFLKVIDPKEWPDGTAVVTEDEFEDIRQGKERRSDATLDDEMRRYNRLENNVLSRVLHTLDNGFRAIGVRLPASKWFGPGQAAQAWLKSENVTTAEAVREKVPLWFREAARMSYFGGWFEIMMHGIIPGESHEYDINSAYPSVIKSLPCLEHGTYTRGEGLPPKDCDGHYTLVYANIWSPGMPQANGTQQIGAMLHRDAAGQIFRPMATEGWYWWDELKAAESAGLVKRLDNRGKQLVQRWVSYKPCDCPPPLRNVESLYQRRLQVGKKSPSGKAAKLVYNSMYGKFAQSVGEPVYGNPVYASRITSQCRTQILRAIASHPNGKKDVAMVATDGLYFVTPHPGLKVSDSLGDWEYKVRSNLTLFKPGVYWDDETRQRIRENKSPNFKARGFKPADFALSIARIDAEFERRRIGDAKDNRSGRVWQWPSVEFTPNFVMITALQALMRGDWPLAGQTYDHTTAKAVTQDSNPSTKRGGVYRDEYEGRVILRSSPHTGMAWNGETGQMEWVASQPYTKRFGDEDPWSDENKAQWGENPDGPIGDILNWVLKGN